MERDEQNKMVIENWIRVLFGDEFILDLILMIVEFSKFHEKFDSKFTSKDLIIEKDGVSVISMEEKFPYRKDVWISAFGSFIAKPGAIYIWEIELTQCNHGGICIGILRNKCCDNYYEYWWRDSDYRSDNFIPEGYAWYTSDHSTMEYKPKDGDTVKVWLDLKVNTVKYLCNDKIVTEEKVLKDECYRLAIGFFGYHAPSMVEIINLTINAE